jgi:hypothetical protein
VSTIDVMRARSIVAAVGALAALLLAAGCGGSSGGGNGITIPKAKIFRLTDWSPAKLQPGRPEQLSFVIQQPSGQPLTSYRRGPGPHTGVHLIIVRDDLSTIIHRHPPLGKNGRFTQSLTFPSAGRYRVVVDAYPKTNDPTLRNFQLFRYIQVGHGDPAAKLPPPGTVDKVDGYTFKVKGVSHLKALAPGSMKVTVRTPSGGPADFIPYYGALAHAIFFQRGSLDYFHTHVCGPSTPGCTSILGAVKVRGTSSSPGEMNVGVLVPVPGTWRLFLQAQVAKGKILTAPFTLKVA